MINRIIVQSRGWLRNNPMRLEIGRTWLPFWVGFLAVLFGYAFQPGGLFFPKEDETWAAMQASGRWRIGVDPSFPPFEFLDESGKPAGFDLALAAQIADQWGLEVEVVPMGFDSLVDAVRSGQIDSVVSALPYDPRLTKDVRYSTPYFDAGILLTVRQDSPLIAEASTAFIETEDAPRFLSGKRIGVEWGGMGDMMGRRYQRLVPEIELVAFSTPQEAVTALQNDPTIDAIMIDNVTLNQMRGSATIVGLGPILESNPYVIALPIEATILAQSVDESLANLQETGEIAALGRQWFQTQ